MSQEKVILDIVNKLNEIKDIIAPTSDIEKSLESLNVSENALELKDLLKNTKLVVDKLYKHVGELQKTFYQHILKYPTENCDEELKGDSSDITIPLGNDSNIIEDSFGDPSDTTPSKLSETPNEVIEKSTDDTFSENLDNSIISDPIDCQDKETESVSLRDDKLANPDDDKSIESENTSLESVNNEIDNIIDDVKNKEDTSVKEEKPRIKLVDINKLVNPKSNIDISSKPKKNVSFDSSVIILTDSDEETHNRSKRKSTSELKVRKSSISEGRQKSKSKDKNRMDSDSDSDEKNKKAHRRVVTKSKGSKSIISKHEVLKGCVSLSDSEPSDSEKSNLDKKSNKNIVNGLSESKTSKDKAKSINSSSSDDENYSKKPNWLNNVNNNIDQSSDEMKSGKTKKQNLSKKITVSDTSDIDSEDESNSKEKSGNKKRRRTKKINKNSIKPSSGKLYIRLPLIPCEKLKETYIKNREILQVKRLTNMDTLKSKRSRPVKGSSPKSSDTDHPKSKKQKQNDSSDTENLSDIGEVAPSPSKQESEANSDEVAESVVNDIHDLSDAENAEKSEDEETKKTDKKQHKNKSKPTEEESNKSEDEDGNKQSEVSSGSEDEKKDKKKWKKDKLLTADLSSTDTEKEYQKYVKKKQKVDDENSSDSDNIKSSRIKGKSKKTRKRIKIVIDSDSDNTGNKSSGEEFQSKDKSSSSDNKSDDDQNESDKEKSKPTRKRIKKTKESSSDDEDKSTRKQIRRVMGRDSLSDKTKKAEADERERKARIAEKQKKYNMMLEAKDMNATVDKLVLDFNEKTNEELLKVDDKLLKKLKPHQASGIKFMWDACFESLERAKSTKGSGCILAHCMGLGKTLQVITLTQALLVNSEQTGVERVMVVCPVNTVLNWKSEFKKWLPKNDDFEVYELVSCKQNYERQYQVTDWFRSGGVLIIGYNMFRTLSNPDNKKVNKKMRTAFYEGLVDPGPDLVVCDEGHLLKNEKTNLSIAMNRIKSQRRIVLTGTPLQNNLKEYWCMVQFVKPNLLGTYKEYLNRFVNPITNGQYTDSTQHDIQIMRRRAHVLHKMLDGIVQRRDYAVLEPYLPPKHEYVLFVNLTEVQIKIYEHYIKHFARQSDGSNRTSFLFTDFQQLQRICTHPRVLLDKSKEDREKKDLFDDEEDSEGSLKDFIDDGSESSSSDTSKSDKSSKSDSEKEPVKKRNTRAARAQRRENNESDSDIEMVKEEKKEWWQEYCDGDELDNINNSGKMFLLFEILKECEQIGDKILIFSQSLYTLNCIEYFLNKIDEATQNGNVDLVGGHSGNWSIGLDYFRLDGSSSCDNRAAWCDMFNSPANTRARLFLISTKAGGLGINLTAANRVIIFDVSWNPSHDIQSIYRVYRFGQTKPSYVYRFVTYGTMEMKIYERQVTKQAISKRVIDEQQIDRHYNQNDLQELYKCDLRPTERPTPLVPKDVLLGEMLHTYATHIYKYHEHQSLLENKEEEGLNEEERKAAWEEFENEKVNRFNSAGTSNISTHTVAAALSNIVRRDNPTWTDVQIKGIIPALVQQLQVQLQAGDMTMYQRVQHEIKLMQAQHAQRLREQYYQQQVMRMIQAQQQQQNMMGNLSVNPTSLYNMLAQTGSSNNPTNEIIELN